MRQGNSITLVGSSYSTLLLMNITAKLIEKNINPEIIDLRIINPLNIDKVIESVKKTGHLFVLDGGWGPCGISSEIIASVMEKIDPNQIKSRPKRMTLPFTPAPTSKDLELSYYPNKRSVTKSILQMFDQ